MNEPERAQRYGTGSENLVPFFNGEYVTKRMDWVRDAIIQVRHRPDRYDELARSLSTLLDRMADEYVSSALNEKQRTFREQERNRFDRRKKAIFSARRDWVDRSGATTARDDAYEVARVYTSDIGQKLFADVAKRAFRDANVSDDAVILATFFVELLNIDLYNYWYTSQDARDFTGTIFRGVNMLPDHLEDFHRLLASNLPKRYYSVPLALDSCSRQRSQAEKFFGAQTNLLPVLHRVHVIGLLPSQAKLYRDRFPSSVVSTICATPLRALSDFASEDEVLLRGPFFQLLGYTKEDGVNIVDSVVVTANRDHFSTPQTGERDEARKLLGALVALRKNAFCVEWCQQHGQETDTSAYEQALEASRANFLREHGVTAPT